jgi:predicted ABC-type ATPase
LKTLYIIAGANGSGKTTFAQSFAELEKLKFINADEIAKTYDPQDIQKYKVKAGKQFFKELSLSLDGNDSFIIETTLSGKYLSKVIQNAKNKQFYVVLIYLFLETKEENIYRVKNRVLNGGHSVPQEDIIRRYFRSRKLFWNVYKNLVNEWSLFYNGDNNFELVANQQEIIDEYAVEQFLEGALDE